MKVLLTNDDGYRAKGIHALANALTVKGHDVIIVAPERQRSAASHAVTLHKPLRLTHATEYDNRNLAVYFTSGTPTDSTMLGCLEVAPDADIVISGINSGPNLGEDVIYSGTVAGATEGALIGKKSIAVSLSIYGNEEYELASVFTVELAEKIFVADLPSSTVLNVNVPPVKKDDYKGYRIVPLGTRDYKDILDKRVDPRGGNYFWIAGDIVHKEQPNTDVGVVLDGFISISPIRLNLTDNELLSKLDFGNISF